MSHVKQEMQSVELPQKFFHNICGCDEEIDFELSLDTCFEHVASEFAAIRTVFGSHNTSQDCEDEFRLCYGCSEDEFDSGAANISDEWKLVAPIIGRHILNMSHSERGDVFTFWLSERRRGVDWQTIMIPYAEALSTVTYHGSMWYPEWIDADLIDVVSDESMIDQDKVDQFAAMLVYHQHWPFRTPCEVFWLDNRLVLTDGFHRAQALKKLNQEQIFARITYGDLQDAIMAIRGYYTPYSGPTDTPLPSDDQNQPQQRTQRTGKELNQSTVQKRERITDAIAANQTASDREIARLIGCDHKTVGSVRRSKS